MRAQFWLILDMKRDSKYSKVRFIFRDDPEQRAVELNIELMTPLQEYKRLYEDSLQCDLYGKQLIFQVSDHAIRYGHEAIEPFNKTITQVLKVDVYYRDFADR